MKILIKRGRRRKTESGIYTDEKMDCIQLEHTFDKTLEESNCGCDVCKKGDSVKVKTIPFKKYNHPCTTCGSDKYEVGCCKESIKCKSCK